MNETLLQNTIEELSGKTTAQLRKIYHRYSPLAHPINKKYPKLRAKHRAAWILLNK